MEVFCFLAGVTVGAGVSAAIVWLWHDDHEDTPAPPQPQPKQPRGPDGRYVKRGHTGLNPPPRQLKAFVERGQVGGDVSAPRPTPPNPAEFPSTLKRGPQ